MSSEIDNDEEYHQLTEDQEEAVEMIRQAVFESGDTGLPEEVLVVVLLQMAAEISVQIEVPKQEFLDGASAIYSETKEKCLIDRASNLTPVDE